MCECVSWLRQQREQIQREPKVGFNVEREREKRRKRKEGERKGTQKIKLRSLV